MDIRKLSLQDDVDTAARLVYQTDPFFFPYLFGKQQKATRQIAKLIRLNDNSFSHKYMWRCGENDIAGILIGLMPGDIDEKRERADFGVVFSLWVLVKIGFKNSMLNLIMGKHVDGAYIQNICVDESSRGKGIGSALIKHFCDHAACSGRKSVYLDVYIDNDGARRLYERHGFAVVKKSTFKWLKGGVYRMKKEL